MYAKDFKRGVGQVGKNGMNSVELVMECAICKILPPLL